MVMSDLRAAQYLFLSSSEVVMFSLFSFGSFTVCLEVEEDQHQTETDRVGADDDGIGLHRPVDHPENQATG